MSTQPLGGFGFLRQTDLDDPNLFKLNQVLSTLFNNSTSGSDGTWTTFAPTFGGSLTLNTFVSNTAQYQHSNQSVFLNLDIQFNVASGTANSFTIALPQSYPPQTTNSYGNVLGCVLIISGAEVAAIARVSNMGVIVVQRADGANFATGTKRVLVTGFYRTAS